MSVPASISGAIGAWRGTSRLLRPWLAPAESVSPSTADVRLLAAGRFMTIRYTWALDGEDHEGLLLIGAATESPAATAVWVDSWHMSDTMMMCHGTVNEAGVVSVTCRYAAPPDPDWSWRTVVECGQATLRLVMYNISPDGEEALAVDAQYERAPEVPRG